MYVRPITAKEAQRAQEINQIAFGYLPDPSAQEPAEENEGWRDVRAAFDDQDQMTACMVLVPFCVRFEGQEVGMGGIGGVASLPESRHQGNVRAILQAALREMYDREMVFSILYPFSHVYYRKFGYELTHRRQRLVYSTRDIRLPRPVGGRFVQWTPDQDNAPLRLIYDRFVQDTNLSVIRGDKEWKTLADRGRHHRPYYTYLWYDEEDVAQAYFSFYHESREGQRTLIVDTDDYAYAGPRGLAALFSMHHALCAQYPKAQWQLPEWADATALFPEPYDLDVQIQPRAMSRVVNVEKALSLLRYPEEPGTFTLLVEDPILPQNQGLWQVDFAGGQAEVRRIPQGAADLRVDIPALTQLLAGNLDLETLLTTRFDLDPSRNVQTLERVFQRRRVLLLDFF